VKRLNVRDPVSVAWECQECGHRHAWQWKQEDLEDGWLLMRCDSCDDLGRVRLVRIGRDAWAGEWLR
jgi:NAD-dependent SIR2 family protein deacetylase